MSDERRAIVEVVPWLADHFGPQPRGRLLLYETLPAGATILDLVRTLARRHPSFGKLALQEDGLSRHVAVLLNDQWLQSSEALNQPLRDGDKITLLPAFTGG